MARWTSERGISARTQVPENGRKSEFIEPSLTVLAAEPPNDGRVGVGDQIRRLPDARAYRRW